MIDRHYIATPTLSRFHACSSNVRGIMGPTGCGKSVGCVVEGAMRSSQQQPAKNGIRYSRGVVIRNTYPQLKSTTIKTWLQWMGHGRMTYGAPISWKWQTKDIGDGTGIDMEVLFLSVDRPEDVGKLKSLEATWIWINEACEIPFEIVQWAMNRVGRYPDIQIAPLTWSGLFMDTNAMDTDHWWYRLAEIEKPKGWDFFKQPPAVIKKGSLWTINPKCEAREYQPKKDEYWLDQISGHNEEWIKIYLQAEYGVIVDGRAVYTEYVDYKHCPEVDLQVYRGIPLWLGWDFGLTPSVAFCQFSPKGQLRIIDELTSKDMGITQFVTDVVKPHVSTYYAGMEIRSVGDPAGSARAQTDERTCYDAMAENGFPAYPARTPNFIPRRESVAAFMLRSIEGGEPAFLLSRKCKNLRLGFQGKYFFRRVGSGDRLKTEVDDNQYTHLQDCVQYVALEVTSGGGSRNTQTHSARQVTHKEYPY